jgi:ABC-type cobalamin/Fe3+-siderophores transport system ATPase subunit
MNSLETKELVVRRGGRAILEGVTLHLRRGELLAIVGPNGSGKSSLLRALAGLWRPSGGEVSLDARSLAEYSRRELARHISFVPQDTRIGFAFTVEELISMGRYPHRGRFAREGTVDRAAIESAMSRCDVLYLSHRYANTLSDGERQRVWIARTLAVDPDFILLDEPTSNLDVEHSLAVLDLCSTLRQSGKAVAVTTHDLNAVARYATAVVLLHEGRLVAQGRGEHVLTPSALESVFGVDTEVLSSRNGQPVYLFHRRADR